MAETTEVVDDVYMVDTLSYGHREHTAAYLVDGKRPAVVETGLSNTVDRVLSAVDDVFDGRDAVEHVVPTHVHLDHAGGAGYLMEELPEAELVVHENGYPYLTDPKKTKKLVESVRRAVGEMADSYGDAHAVDPERARAVTYGDTVDLGDRTLDVVEAPGHAPHQFALLDGGTNSLFTADEAGMHLDGTLVRTTPPPNFDLEKNVDSLRRFRDLEPDRLVYTHYGVREDVEGALDEYENVLRNWVREVKDAVRTEADEEAALTRLVEETGSELYPEDWSDEHVAETIRMDARGVMLYLD